MLTPRWEALERPDDLDLGDGSGVLLAVRHGKRYDRLRRISVEGGGRRWRWAGTRHSFDTIAAIVAALVIIPACFSYNVTDVGAGPSLLFVTLA